MLLTSPPPDWAAFDVCVVGAGPIGLALALEAARDGTRVLLIEAGSASRKAMTVTPADPTIATVLDDERHASLSDSTWRGVGGASWLWGGRCVPFEPIDFTAREYVPHSGWPLSAADVAPWQDRAAHYLDCGTADFHTRPLDGWAAGSATRTSQQERWSRRPRLGRGLGALVVAHRHVWLLPDARVTDIRFDPAGRTVTGLRVQHGQRETDVRAASYVLACGGVATTRLLLSVQRRLPALFGGPTGPLGRYYMGHLTGSIAAILLTRPDDFRDLDFQQDADGTYVRRRFTLSERAQREDRTLNTSFYLGNLPFGDAEHGNGALSLFFLALALPAVGSRLVGQETVRRNIGPRPRRWRCHLRNIARHPAQVLRDVAGIVRLRFLASPRRWVFVLRSERGAYAIHYHAEQIPNPDSRVTLKAGVGSDGLPGVDIDFRYSEQDVGSVLRSHAVLDRELRATGYGRLVYRYPEQEREAAVRAQAADGYHQVGTTRMSSDPQDGVVDPDCRVHGVANLFVASSSVFPTAGEANPTFMAVTLAVRLAHRLAEVRTAAA